MVLKCYAEIRLKEDIALVLADQRVLGMSEDELIEKTGKSHSGRLWILLTEKLDVRPFSRAM